MLLEPISCFLKDFQLFYLSNGVWVLIQKVCSNFDWSKGSEKNIWEKKIAARKLEEETFIFSLDGPSNHDFPALRFILSLIVWEQFKSRARYAVTEWDLILCVHNK